MSMGLPGKKVTTQFGSDNWPPKPILLNWLPLIGLSFARQETFTSDAKHRGRRSGIVPSKSHRTYDVREFGHILTKTSIAHVTYAISAKDFGQSLP